MSSTTEDTLELQLTIASAPGAPRVPLVVASDISSAALREQAAQTTKIPLGALKLIFRGRLIGADASQKAVPEFKLEAGSVVHCMGKPVTSSNETTTAAAAPVASASVAASATPSVAAPRPSSTTAPTATTLDAALQTMRTSISSDDYKTALTTLDKLLANILQHPTEEKYRRVKQQNPAFQRRLGGHPGADAALKAVGFTIATEDGQPVYLLQATAEAWNQLQASKATIEAALRTANQSFLPPPQPSFASGMSSANNPGGMPPMGGMPSGAEAAAMQQMMANPAMLQQMLQNPMVQTMMRNDPRLANNPQMRQALDAMIANPQLLQQMSQMAGNPQMMEQMRQMSSNPQMMEQMRQMAAMMPPGGAGGGGFPPMPQSAGGGGQPPSQQQGQPPARSDDELTEEEMIAEAIRRSLQDGQN